MPFFGHWLQSQGDIAKEREWRAKGWEFDEGKELNDEGTGIGVLVMMIGFILLIILAMAGAL
jgi:hypothetical protein